MQKKTIPGIYNYCDRWCERCNFTNRCAIYDDPVTASRRIPEMPHRSLLDSLSLNLAKARAVLDEAAREHGLDLTLSEVQNAWHNEVAQPGPMRKQHPLSIQSLDYDMRVFRWMASLDVSREHLVEGCSYGSKIQESTTVIARYSALIHVKLCRAISSIVTTDQWAEDNGLQKDSDGSAKIALMAMERSLEEWRILYHSMQEFEDDILAFLVSLEQLRKTTLEFFPNAMKFVRPGFDTQVRHRPNL